jgi:hypothetical protein
VDPEVGPIVAGPDRWPKSALDNVFAPDVHWYAANRVPSADAGPPYPMPDLGVKKTGYERHGLRELAGGYGGAHRPGLPPVDGWHI